MKLNKKIFIITASMLMIDTIYAKNGEKGDRSFFLYQNSETQFKEDIDSLSYSDILSLLEKTSTEKQITSLDTIFNNRVSKENKELPLTTEGTDQRNDTGKNSNNKDTSQSQELEKSDYNSMKQESGTPQLILGGKTADDLMKESNFPCSGGFHIQISGKTYSQMKDTFGTSAYFNERGSYNPPIPHYTQKSGVEKWDGFRIGGNLNLVKEGCYIYMHAYIFTSFTGKVINPAEMSIWLAHYGLILNSGLRSPNKQNNLSALYNEIGYKIKIYKKNEITDEVIDKVKGALLQGIPQGIRTSNYPNAGYPTHFLCISGYDKDSDSFIYSQCASKVSDTKVYPAKDLVKNLYNDDKECLYLITRK